jgi:hypothetical protein
MGCLILPFQHVRSGVTEEVVLSAFDTGLRFPAGQWNTEAMPLEGKARLLVVIAVLALAGCGGSPTEPSPTMLAGRWSGSLERQPCVGDWSSITLLLQQSGASLTGQLVTKDEMTFVAEGTVNRQTAKATIAVQLPPGAGECDAITFVVDRFDLDALGNVAAFSGRATGRCCGTIDEPFRFVRA